MAKDIHPMDQIELHKQTGEMVYATLANRATLAHELKESLKNTNTQLDLERMSSQAKDNRIKTLEEIIIDLGHDPKDPKGVRALMKKKDDDIAALKKRLRLPPTEHPQTAALVQEKETEDTLDLLMKMNQRVIQMEEELERAAQSKQGESSSQPPPAVQINVPIPPIQPVAIPEATSATTTIETTTPSESSMSMEQMMKAVKELELQTTEIKEAREKLANLEGKYDKSKMAVAEKTREIKALNDKIKALEKELALDKTLIEIKKILWAKINQSITGQWRSIQAMYEQVELIGLAQFETQRAKEALGNMPEQANKMINFLNHQTKEELAALQIMSRTDAILTAKKVLTLRGFVQTLEARCREMQKDVDNFEIKLAALQTKGLPSLLTSVGRLLTREQYATRLNNYVTNQLTASSSSPAQAGPPSGQTLYDKMENLFYMKHEVNHLFEMPPNYYKYTEADETLIKIQRHQIPPEDWCQAMLAILPR